MRGDRDERANERVLVPAGAFGMFLSVSVIVVVGSTKCFLAVLFCFLLSEGVGVE